MDLALHLGMTADGLARQMTQRELRDWQRYAARRMLPWRRMEMYLAQLTAAVAASAGSKKGLADFLFDRAGDDDEDGGVEMGAMTVIEG